MARCSLQCTYCTVCMLPGTYSLNVSAHTLIRGGGGPSYCSIPVRFSIIFQSILELSVDPDEEAAFYVEERATFVPGAKCNIPACPCEIAFVTFKSYCTHWARAHKPCRTIHLCSLCGKVYDEAARLRRHLHQNCPSGQTVVRSIASEEFMDPLCILPYKLGTRPDREKCARRKWAQTERQQAAGVTGTPLNDTSVHVCRDEAIREVDGIVYKVTNLWDKEKGVKPTATQYTCPQDLL